MPIAPSTRPPHQHNAATNAALRGPTRSSQPPQIAAETPRITKNSVYIQPMLATFQSQVVVNSSWNSEMSGQAFGAVMPIARDSGSQNTEKPYAMPMHRWMQSAAGGTSQRLKPAAAIVRSLSRKPVPAELMPPVLLIVVIRPSSQPSLGGQVCLIGPSPAFARNNNAHYCPAATIS